jgi:formylmethanofuran dehydrogenase subunit B
LRESAEALRTAACGVVIWSAAETDGLCIEMLCGMIDDLNRTTRCFGLPLPGPDNLAGVMQAIGWRAGFPLRVGFARGRPEHDPWRFEASRMAAAGEADVALWIGAALPDWAAKLRLIALLPAGAQAAGAEVAIFIGRPGVDHDAVLHEPATGALGFRRGQGEALSAAAVLTAITAAVGASC